MLFVYFCERLCCLLLILNVIFFLVLTDIRDITLRVVLVIITKCVLTVFYLIYTMTGVRGVTLHVLFFLIGDKLV